MNSHTASDLSPSFDKTTTCSWEVRGRLTTDCISALDGEKRDVDGEDLPGDHSGVLPSPSPSPLQQVWSGTRSQWSRIEKQEATVGLQNKVKTKDCVVQGSAKCQTIQTIFKPNHQNGMKTMMYDVSQVVSYSGMMKGKGILLRYNCPSLHITFNIILGPIYLNLDLGLINWFIKHDSSPFQAWIELNGGLAYPCWTILD